MNEWADDRRWRHAHLSALASCFLLGVTARKRAKPRAYLCQASLTRRDRLRAAVRNGAPLRRAGELWEPREEGKVGVERHWTLGMRKRQASCCVSVWVRSYPLTTVVFVEVLLLFVLYSGLKWGRRLCFTRKEIKRNDLVEIPKFLTI